MEKDNDLPLTARVAHRALVLLLVGFVAHCYIDWFGDLWLG